ncbi:MAG: hypothetical protein ACLPJW_12120 [Rhodomicrobium sp.]
MALDLDSLRVLAVPDMGTSLEVPHPSSLGVPEVTPLTGWHPSADPRDFETTAGLARDCIFGRIVESVLLDEYDEPIGKTEYVLEHKLEHMQRKTKDVATTVLRPRTMAGEKHPEGHYTTLPLRRRFPAAFAQFEERLGRLGKPSPLALLDNVPPEVCETLLALGLNTIQEFAAADDEFLAKLSKRLENDRHVSRAGKVHDYRERAREKAGIATVESGEAPRPRPARKAA